MRILGYLDHPSLKITVFKTDTRLSIKFENGSFEQTYKFRPSEKTNSLLEINKLVDENLLDQVASQFRQMEKNFNDSFLRNFPPSDDDEFDEII